MRYGYSAALGLYVCWEHGRLRWYDAATGYLRTHDEERNDRILERGGRIAAEVLRDAATAQRDVMIGERDAMAAERDAERNNRLAAEVQRDAEHNSRIATETENQRLRDEIARLRAGGDGA